MRIAFYYHITIYSANSTIQLPSFLGVFIDALAKEVKYLKLVAHEVNHEEIKHCDYRIQSKNVQLISLGAKTPAWHRELFHRRVLKSALKQTEDCDIFIVRAPTPLASHFHNYIASPKLWFMIVGDYLEAIEHLKNSTFRNKLIYYYLHINDFFFQRQARKTPIVVNSPALFEKYKKVNNQVLQIRTTTLTNGDFFARKDTCEGSKINVLYTGSFSPAKGLFELVGAMKILIDQGIQATLHLVGWEDDSNKPVEKALLEKAKNLSISQHIVFHGKKTVGENLNKMYRMSDIFVMPSHHEGFPRTIWEAMANSLPVIATAVGGIPKILVNEKNALLITPKRRDEIADAIKLVYNDSALRQNLIIEGFQLAKENTLDIQTKKLVEILKNKSKEL